MTCHRNPSPTHKPFILFYFFQNEESMLRTLHFLSVLLVADYFLPRNAQNQTRKLSNKSIITNETRIEVLSKM
jgi:hypothetical protein